MYCTPCESFWTESQLVDGKCPDCGRECKPAKEEDIEKLTQIVLKTGEFGLRAMALLDQANTMVYGTPEMTEINIGAKQRPGILVSGHDLKDLHQLLEQTKGKGIDVYTHGEMLPANTYPMLKKYSHLAGNYGRIISIIYQFLICICYFLKNCTR